MSEARCLAAHSLVLASRGRQAASSRTPPYGTKMRARAPASLASHRHRGSPLCGSALGRSRPARTELRGARAQRLHVCASQQVQTPTIDDLQAVAKARESFMQPGGSNRLAGPSSCSPPRFARPRWHPGPAHRQSCVSPALRILTKADSPRPSSLAAFQARGVELRLESFGPAFKVLCVSVSEPEAPPLGILEARPRPPWAVRGPEAV